MEYTDIIFYDEGGHTDSKYYIRFVVAGSSDEVKYIWDNVNKELVASLDWEDSVINLNEVGETGAFPVEVPDDLPVGKRYDVIVYKVESESEGPVSSDNVQKVHTLSHGSIFGF